MTEQTKEPKHLGKKTGSVSLATLISRIAGFLRDMFIADRFGTTSLSDLFYIGYRIPNMLRELFAEGALSSAFIPSLSRTLATKGVREASRLYTAVLYILVIILGGVILLGELFAPEILRILAPGYSMDPHSRTIGITLIRIMFPFLFFISLSALLMGILNVENKFFLPAFSPAFFSLGLVIGMVLPSGLTDHHPVYGLAMGVILGGIFQWALQWFFMKKDSIGLDLSMSLKEGIRHTEARRVMRLIIPSIGGLWVMQGNLLIATILGSYLAKGTISSLYYAMRLVQFPLGLIGAAIATVILPILARQSLEENAKEKSLHTLKDGYRLSLYFMLPATAGLLSLGEPLIKIIFEHGSFRTQSAHETLLALWGYAIGLWSFSGVRILVRIYYAVQNTRFPVKAAIFGLLANLIVSVVFLKSLGIISLAVGITIGSIVNQLVLFYGSKKIMGQWPWVIFGNLLPVLGWSSGLFILEAFLWKKFTVLFPAPSPSLIAMAILFLIVSGATFYIMGTIFSGVEEGRLLLSGSRSLLKRLLRRSR